MKRKSLITLLLIGLFVISSSAPPEFQVKQVNDGDTILLSTGQRVRYVGIDAPEIGYEGEKNEPMGLASKALNRCLLGKGKVRLECDRVKQDRHGRLLAYVYLENGDMVNALLVRQGMAHVLAVKPNLKHFSLLLEQQRKAMKEKIGIWRRNPKTTEKTYFGNVQSYRFHRPSCPFAKAMAPHRRVGFKSRYSAFWEGYSPCRRCKP